jgi:hypothetical protein
MVTVSQIKIQIRRLLDHERSLDDFNQWLASNSWNITKEQPNSKARAMTGEIELALAEYSEGHLSMHDLRERLSALLSSPRMRSRDTHAAG